MSSENPWQADDRLWGGVGVGQSPVPGVTWQSQPQLSLEVFSLLQLEFVSPSSPYVGTDFLVGSQEETETAYAWYDSANLPLPCTSLERPRAWCPGDDGAVQSRRGQYTEKRGAGVVSDCVFELTAPNLHHPKEDHLPLANHTLLKWRSRAQGTSTTHQCECCLVIYQAGAGKHEVSRFPKKTEWEGLL